MVENGYRCVMVYLIQRSDTESFKIAQDIDPKYAQAFEYAKNNGVETIAYDCTLSPKAITVRGEVPIV